MAERAKLARNCPRRWRLLTAGALSAVALLASTPAAGAHEVGLVVVADADTAGKAIDGFRLAIDQSPDVSHAPGPDAGDHLGGIDVDVTVVERGAQLTARRVAREISSGARIVVVLPPGSDSREIVPGIRAQGTLIVVAGTRAALPEKPELPVVLLGTRPVRRVDRERAARFERVFARRYGRAPGRADRRGYDAGRLLDRVLARLGEGPFVEPALSTAVARADRALVGATASVVPAVARDDDAGMSAGGDGIPVAAMVTAAGLAVTLLVGSFALRLGRRRRRSTIPR